MNRKVLIISPYFAPSNAADMHRIRISLPYFREFGWDAEVVTVDEKYSDMVKDELLLQSIPSYIKIHQVKAFNKKWTSKLGLGSLALRSLWFYKKAVNRLLSANKFDLIYFSTTAFPVCILGSYWKKKFNTPYVIDMQDPWHSEYYRDKPRHQQPPKYWFSYRLNKYLEPLAMKYVSGLISVSENYIADLKARYVSIKNIPAVTITFGAFTRDLEIAENNRQRFKNILPPGHINIAYIGRGGEDMHRAIGILFSAFKSGVNTDPELFEQIRMWFIGTSYAPAGEGELSIMPLANKFGIQNNVIEITDRIDYYHSLSTLQQADILFIPGSDDPKYSASKIYPYLLCKKPLIAIFNSNSNVVDLLNTCTKNAVVLTFGDGVPDDTEALHCALTGIIKGIRTPVKLLENFNNYSARHLTRKQCELFSQVSLNQ